VRLGADHHRTGLRGDLRQVGDVVPVPVADEYLIGTVDMGIQNVLVGGDWCLLVE